MTDKTGLYLEKFESPSQMYHFHIPFEHIFPVPKEMVCTDIQQKITTRQHSCMGDLVWGVPMMW